MDEWFQSHANVLKLADWLADNGHLETAKEAIYYFSKPWKYNSEWEQMVTEELADKVA